MGGEVFGADAALRRVGVEGAVGAQHAVLQPDGVQHAQRVGVVGRVVGGDAVHIQCDRVDADRDGRRGHGDLQRLAAAGVGADRYENVVDVAAAVDRAVKRFAAAGRGKVAGIGLQRAAARLRHGGRDKVRFQVKLYARPQDALDPLHLHIIADGVGVGQVPAVHGVVALDLGGPLGRVGDGADDLLESVPEIVGVIGRVVGVGVVEAGRGIRRRGDVDGIILHPAGARVLDGGRRAGAVLLPGRVDGVDGGDRGRRKLVLAVPVGAGFQNQVGHRAHALVLVGGHETDGIGPGRAAAVRVIVGADPVFHVGGRDERHKAVAAVRRVVVAAADGGVGQAVPPFAARGRGREGRGRAVRHQDQVGDAGKGLAFELDRRRGGRRQHLEPAVQPGVDVCVGIERDCAVKPDLAGDLHVAVVAVVRARRGRPVRDDKILLIRARGDRLQIEHILRAAVEHNDADAVFRAGVGERVNGLVDGVDHGLHAGTGLVGDGPLPVFVLAPGHAGREIEHKDDVDRGAGGRDELGGGCQRRVSDEEIGIVVDLNGPDVARKRHAGGGDGLVHPDTAVLQGGIGRAEAGLVAVAGVGVGHAHAFRRGGRPGRQRGREQRRRQHAGEGARRGAGERAFCVPFPWGELAHKGIVLSGCCRSSMPVYAAFCADMVEKAPRRQSLRGVDRALISASGF